MGGIQNLQFMTLLMYLERELTKMAVSERYTLKTVVLMQPVIIGWKAVDDGNTGGHWLTR
jgi:hypothetical protein